MMFVYVRRGKGVVMVMVVAVVVVVAARLSPDDISMNMMANLLCLFVYSFICSLLWWIFS